MSASNELSPLVTALFMGAWFVGVTSWLLGIAEMIGAWRFQPWAYRLGPCVLRERRRIPQPPRTAAQAPTPVETANAKFKLVAWDCCLFRDRMPLFRFRVNTPFPARGTIRWNGADAEIECRIPLFTTVFFATWLAGWTTIAVAGPASGAPALQWAGPLAFGWILAAVMAAISIPLEIWRARRALAEVEAWLAGTGGAA